MPLDPDLYQRIELAINQLGQEYRRTPGLILTEDDLKCLLFKKFSEIGHLLLPQPTVDPHVNSVNLHAEVSWYDQDGRLAIKPDITILETENLSILHGLGERVQLPSKQFHFHGRAIVLELKFIKNQTGVTKAALKTIQDDILKIQGLYNRPFVHENIYCFFVIFSKSPHCCHEFEEFLAQHGEANWYKILYRSGHVLIQPRRRNGA